MAKAVQVTSIAKTDVAAGDFDGDGRDDLAVAHSDPTGVAVLFRDPGGEYRRVDAGDFRGFVVGHSRVFLSDGDGDGDLDVILHRDLGAYVDIVANLGGRTFDSRPLPGQLSQVRHDALVEPLDLDGDGDADFAALSSDGVSAVATLEGAWPERHPCRRPFRRGDLDAGGGLDIADAIALLDSLFVTGEALPCLEAGDVNNDGEVGISDAIALLSFLFLGGAPPPEPFGACGLDPDPPLGPGDLGCERYPARRCSGR